MFYMKYLKTIQGLVEDWLLGHEMFYTLIFKKFIYMSAAMCQPERFNLFSYDF